DRAADGAGRDGRGPAPPAGGARGPPRPRALPAPHRGQAEPARPAVPARGDARPAPGRRAGRADAGHLSGGRLSPLAWLRQKDPTLMALRRASRTAIVMPSLLALSVVVIDDPQVATFAAFGTFAMLNLVDFSGPIRARVQAEACLALAGGVLVCI